MSMKYFVDENGRYLGGFDGPSTPQNSTEIDAPPPDGRMVWNGTEWTVPSGVARDYVREQRRNAYNAAGINGDVAVVALWEKIMEDRPQSSDALQAIREQIKLQFPYPS